MSYRILFQEVHVSLVYLPCQSCDTRMQINTLATFINVISNYTTQTLLLLKHHINYQLLTTVSTLKKTVPNAQTTNT